MAKQMGDRVETDWRRLLSFWFGPDLNSHAAVHARSAVWFGEDREFDAEVAARFSDWPARAAAGEFDSWKAEPRSALALVLCLDQLPRNLYRNDAAAFGYDEVATRLAGGFVDAGYDRALHPVEAVFLYLPFEHAENLALQRRSVDSFERLLGRAPDELREAFEGFLDYAVQHREIVARFERFPHRNEVLKRESTSEERAFLESGGQTFAGKQSKS
jgi:uncharacterized protein (DUF924 family)